MSDTETIEKMPFVTPRWCVIANVGEEYVTADRPSKGHFAVGAKVYVIGNSYPGMDESVQILARHVGNHAWITFVMRRHMLENYRVVLERSPSVLLRLAERSEFLDEFARVGGETEEHKADCADWVRYWNQQRLDWILGRKRREAVTQETGE